ncbi:MAG: hypothetical protein P8X42_15170 [Calditrichaceae bacterium]
MTNPEKLKNIVKDQYTTIAKKAGCCSQITARNSCCGDKKVDDPLLTADYREQEGYYAEADLSGSPGKTAG